MRTFFFVVLCFLIAGLSSVHSQEPSPSDGVKSQPVQHKSTASKKPTAEDQRGTEKMPLVIKGIPAEKTPEQTQEDRNERQNKAANERGLTIYTGLLALVTFLMVVVGGAQVGLFVWQLRLIRESLTDTKKAADAATIGASATRDSADTAKFSMVASDRAYVHFNGCRWISHPHNTDGHIFWRIRVCWINSGNTPTRGLRIYTHFDFRDDELPLDYRFTQDQTVKPGPVTISPKGIVESGNWDITGTDLMAISKARKYLYIWGRAVYRDVFPGTMEHITKFCVTATNLTGDPLKPWQAETNPFDIAFAVYQRHNCADEDCDQDN